METPPTSTPPPPPPPPVDDVDELELSPLSNPKTKKINKKTASRRSRKEIIDSPVPQPQKVPTLSPPFQFQLTKRMIRTPHLIHQFHNSDTGKNFLGFIVSLSDSIRGYKISDPCYQSKTLNSIVSILETLLRWLDDISPLTRYSETAFLDWRGRLADNAESLIHQLLPDDDEFRSATVELQSYFIRSFGNTTCCIYGVPHEITFAAWLYCLARLGLLQEQDYQAVVSRVFVKYLELMRKLNVVCYVGPLVLITGEFWRFEHYQFLPFIFGSSQLMNHKYMKPKSILNQDILDCRCLAEEYLYLSCIAFLKNEEMERKELFAKYSVLVDDVSRLTSWSIVHARLLQMFRFKVMEALYIIGYLRFGSLIKWEGEEDENN